MAMKKGSMLISYALFFAALISIISAVLVFGLAQMNKYEDDLAVENAITTLFTIERTAQDVAKQAEGARQTITINNRKGEFIHDSANQRITYVVKTDSQRVSDTRLNETSGAPIPARQGSLTFFAGITGGTRTINVSWNYAPLEIQSFDRFGAGTISLTVEHKGLNGQNTVLEIRRK